MTQKRIALYAGSFDPPTNGHLAVIRVGAAMFDELIVAVGINPDKKAMFTHYERQQMLNATTPDNVKTTAFENKYQIDLAQELGASYILRGIRNSEDFQYEQTMRNVNSDMRGEAIQMVYVIPHRDYVDISSSMVKGLIGFKGWEKDIARYVAPVVVRAIKKKMRGKYETPV